MGRRYYRRDEFDPSGLIVLCILAALGSLIKFFKENPVLAILIAIVVIVAIVFLIRFIREKRSIIKPEKTVTKDTKLSEYKGKINELEIYEILNELQIYKKLIKNVYIPIDGKTTEIDVVMITNAGIYVIESKNYTGWIFGNSSSQFWTLTKRGGKFKFLNPLWQNKLHVGSLEKMLNIENKNFESIIVFGPETVLKKIEIMESAIKVICIKDLEETITKIDNIKPKIYSNEEVDSIYLKLRDYKYVDESVKQAHIENINNN